MNDLQDEFSLIGFLSKILAAWRDFAIIAAVCLSLVGAWLLFGPPSYSASIAFSPQVSGASALRGLAAQFGLDPAASEAGQSTDFYQELVRSDRLLGMVVSSRFEVVSSEGTLSGTLDTVLKVRSSLPAVRMDKAIRFLRDALTVSSSRRSGLVTIRVTAVSPELVEQIQMQVLAAVADFNQNLRESRARAERLFVEKRLAQTRAELSKSEERLTQFVMVNRSIQASPELALERDRLARDVSLKQTLVTGLSQGYEQAKIDEVRDTPLLTVMQPASRPVNRDWRPIFAVVSALMVAVLAFAVLELFRHAVATARLQDPESLASISRSVGEIRSSIRPSKRQ
jgi:uncharacterized protein involved in exopolysaccharide biosynthesis